ncbi:MAG: sodium:calcium antiporter, partial [Gemmatimonadota bacterium]
TATLVPGGVPVAPAALHLDLPMMVTVSIASLPIFFAGMRITRIEGGIFLAYYAAYITYLILETTNPDATGTFAGVMYLVVGPLTILLIAILLVRTRLPTDPKEPPGGT